MRKISPGAPPKILGFFDLRKDIKKSRKRYQKAKNFLFSLKENCVKPDLVEIILCIDSDDDSYDKFDHVFEHTKIINETRRNLGQSIFEGIKNSSSDIILTIPADENLGFSLKTLILLRKIWVFR